MDWQHIVEPLGIKLPTSPDSAAVIIAVVLIVGAVAIGWYVASRSGPPLARQLHRLGSGVDVITTDSATAVVRYALISLLLLLVARAVAFEPLALMLIALALGVVVGLLVANVVGILRWGRTTAALLGVVALVATTAGTLGGMAPLLDGLDGIAVSVGTHRISLLTAINAIVTVAILYMLAKAANHMLSHVIARASALDISQRVLVQKLAGIGVVVVAVMLGVDLLGIDLTALTVFSGAAGLAVGFGLQKTFGNLIAGVILLMDRSIKPGDVIVVGETFGAVGKIGVRAVSVVTRDGKEHLIPNEQLMTEPVENWSYSSRNVRLHIPVGIGYGSDLPLAQRLMIKAATAADRVLPEPKPSVWLKGFGDSSVDHDILLWIADPELGVGNVRSDVLNRVWVLFAEHGIEIPFPQRDLHIRTAPGSQNAVSHDS